MTFQLSLEPATISEIAFKVAAYLKPQLDQILKLETQLIIDVTALIAAVAAETTVEKSAVALITQQSATLADIKTQLAAAIAANDPAALAAVQKQIDDAKTALDASTAELASAVTANTPAAPPTT